jgi:hypothetical protein
VVDSVIVDGRLAAFLIKTTGGNVQKCRLRPENDFLEEGTLTHRVGQGILINPEWTYRTYRNGFAVRTGIGAVHMDGCLRSLSITRLSC